MRHVLAALLLWLGSTAAFAQPATPATEYVAAAAATDLYERISAEYVLRDVAVPDDVKRFAQQMVVDHHNTGYQLRQVAGQDGVPAGIPIMTPVQQAMIEQLKLANGEELARIYLIQQLTIHQRAHDLHASYARDGQEPGLRTHAADVARMIQVHIQQIESLIGRN
jgi:putative membrane protein